MAFIIARREASWCQWSQMPPEAGVMELNRTASGTSSVMSGAGSILGLNIIVRKLLLVVLTLALWGN